MLSVAKKILQVQITREGSGFVAECDDLNLVTQGETLDALVANLREAIALALEGEDAASLDLVEQPAVLATIEIELANA